MNCLQQDGSQGDSGTAAAAGMGAPGSSSSIRPREGAVLAQENWQQYLHQGADGAWKRKPTSNLKAFNNFTQAFEVEDEEQTPVVGRGLLWGQN